MKHTEPKFLWDVFWAAIAIACLTLIALLCGCSRRCDCEAECGPVAHDAILRPATDPPYQTVPSNEPHFPAPKPQPTPYPVYPVPVPNQPNNNPVIVLPPDYTGPVYPQPFPQSTMEARIWGSVCK